MAKWWHRTEWVVRMGCIFHTNYRINSPRIWCPMYGKALGKEKGVSDFQPVDDNNNNNNNDAFRLAASKK